MDIRKNMALSLLLHTLLIIPAFSLTGRIGDNPEVSSNCVMVSLLSEMRNMTSHRQEKVKIADTIEGADSPA
ncbi:MAG: hypothetical protein V1764_00375, partial [Nitrospirota bacterium]